MKVFCILGGEGTLRSRSPDIFNRVLRRTGVRGIYVPFQVESDDLGFAVRSLKVLGIHGANVTKPYKEAAVAHMDVLSEGANIIGAINTIVCCSAGLKGYNTNAVGIMYALHQAGFDPAGKRVLVIGTGGAARALVFLLNWLRAAEVQVAGRNLEQARRLVQQFGGRALPLEELDRQDLSVEMLFNATSASSPEEGPEMAELTERMEISSCRLVMDLNYGRPENFWRAWAQRGNIHFMDGLPALACQARRTFGLWTGMQVPAEEFVAALETEEKG